MCLPAELPADKITIILTSALRFSTYVSRFVDVLLYSSIYTEMIHRWEQAVAHPHVFPASEPSCRMHLSCLSNWLAKAPRLQRGHRVSMAWDVARVTGGNCGCSIRKARSSKPLVFVSVCSTFRIWKLKLLCKIFDRCNCIYLHMWDGCLRDAQNKFLNWWSTRLMFITNTSSNQNIYMKLHKINIWNMRFEMLECFKIKSGKVYGVSSE